jgi:hypothetical protein
MQPTNMRLGQRASTSPALFSWHYPSQSKDLPNDSRLTLGRDVVEVKGTRLVSQKLQVT